MVYLKKYSRVTLSTPLPPKSYFQSDDEEARQEGLVKYVPPLTQVFTLN